MPPTITLRPARRDDAATILALIRGLADYEKLAHEVARRHPVRRAPLRRSGDRRGRRRGRRLRPVLPQLFDLPRQTRPVPGRPVRAAALPRPGPRPAADGASGAAGDGARLRPLRSVSTAASARSAWTAGPRSASPARPCAGSRPTTGRPPRPERAPTGSGEWSPVARMARSYLALAILPRSFARPASASRFSFGRSSRSNGDPLPQCARNRA